MEFDLEDVFLDDGSIFDRLLKEISNATGKSIGDVVAMINKKQEQLGNLLSVEVVALIVAKENGLDVSKFIEDVEREVLG